MHNIHWQLRLMADARAAIIQDRYPAFLRAFFSRYFGSPAAYPGWAVEALRGQGVEVLPA